MYLTVLLTTAIIRTEIKNCVTLRSAQHDMIFRIYRFCGRGMPLAIKLIR